MTGLMTAILYFLTLVKWIILVQVIISWLVNFQVLNLRQPLVAQIWELLNRLLEPFYAPLRRVLPSFGGIDFSPMVLLLAVFVLEDFVSKF